MEISKELLSGVLGEDVRLDEYNIIDNDGVPQKYNMKITLNDTTLNYWRYYKEWDDGSTMVSCRININELAFRLKDWVYIQIKDRIDLYYSPVICSQYNIDISSGRSPNAGIKYNSILNKNIKGDYYCRVSESDNSGQYRTFIAETEVEAIVKACEWVLNEKQLQH